MRLAHGTWLRWLVLACAAALACSRPSADEQAASVKSAAPASPKPHTVAEPLSSPTSFELVAGRDGLSLLWASAAPDERSLLQVTLDQRGRPTGGVRRHGSAARAPNTHVTDLVAAELDERLVAAWLEQGEREARAQAAWVEPGHAAIELTLGPAALTSSAARGNIALALEQPSGSALLLWRGLDAPCAERATRCSGFSFRRLTAAGAEVTGLPLAVPVPCSSHAVHLATGAGRFHYGVCSRQGASPVTTLFSIQSEPEFARAEPLLEGCAPLGTVDANGRAWLVGDCAGRRRAARVPLLDEAVLTEALDNLRVSCTPRRLEVTKGRFTLELRSPRAGLERVLPAELVPSGARVAYSGGTVIIAYAAGARLQTSALVCRDGKLAPL